jgi:hypothetical protein
MWSQRFPGRGSRRCQLHTPKISLLPRVWWLPVAANFDRGMKCPRPVIQQPQSSPMRISPLSQTYCLNHWKIVFTFLANKSWRIPRAHDILFLLHGEPFSSLRHEYKPIKVGRNSKGKDDIFSRTQATSLFLLSEEDQCLGSASGWSKYKSWPIIKIASTIWYKSTIRFVRPKYRGIQYVLH